MQQAKQTGKSNRRVWAFVLLGAGLIFVGAAATVLLIGSGTLSQASASEGIAVLPIAVEYPAPELTLLGLDGVEHNLADYRGQVVLVNNWATWCPPCKAEMPALQEYYEKHQAEGFTLIAIEAGDPEDEVRQFVQEYGLTFPVWVDRGLRALSAFRNESLPSSYVIDREGVIRLTWTGPISKKTLENYVTPMLKE